VLNGGSLLRKWSDGPIASAASGGQSRLHGERADAQERIARSSRGSAGPTACPRRLERRDGRLHLAPASRVMDPDVMVTIAFVGYAVLVPTASALGS
jgi:hypothetical protein